MNRKQRRATRVQERQRARTSPPEPTRTSATGKVRLTAPESGIAGFLWQQECRLHLNLAGGHLSVLAPLIERAYEAAFEALPTPLNLLLWRLLALCHRGFLAAVGTIARGQPDDAGAVTRRALEMAKVAIAVKHDPANAGRWAAYETRIARWKARAEGEKPARVQLPQLTYPQNHAVLGQINTFIGVLSDAEVHFTPEFLTQQPLARRAGHVLAPYFVSEPADLDRAARTLAMSQYAILQASDEAFDHTFARFEPFRQAMHTLGAIGRQLATAAATPPR